MTTFRKTLAILCFLAASTFFAPNISAVPPPRKISGLDPFAGCVADNVTNQPGTLYPDSEIEPWLEISPANPQNLIAGWQQDRWSDGGARGLAAGVSIDGGLTWMRIIPPGISKCSGGEYDRASDPWIAISPNGTAYFQSLVFNNNRPDGGGGKNGVYVNRSVNGGISWDPAIPLIIDTDGQISSDKNSITADPVDSNYVYAVWDRFFDFTLPPGSKSGKPALAQKERVKDGVAQARERRRILLERAAKGTAAAAPSFKAPAIFTRTVNGGRSWEVPRTIWDPGPDAQTLGTIVVVHPNGTLINFFMNIGSRGDTAIGLQKSFNKGRSFARPTFPVIANVTPTATLSPDFRESVRDGNLLFDVTVDRQNGNLYLVWQDGRFGNMDKVVFSMSSDEGVTWTPPVRIAMTPLSPVRLRNQSLIPSIEVGANHQLIVTYYDFRFDQSDRRELLDYFAVFCTPSPIVDCSNRRNWGDGATPLKDIRLTRQSFNILDAPFAFGHFLGDYMGLVRKGSAAIPAFGITDSLNKNSIYTTPIRSNVGTSSK